MKSKIKIKDYIDICNKVHSSKYDYSLVDLSKKKIKIICPSHGEFEQDKSSHKFGYGCWKCSVEYRSSRQAMGKELFISKSKEIHGEKYDYSLVDYKNNNTKIAILCKEHGEFNQVPASHLNGNGCPKCGTESQIKLQSHNNEIFISKSKEIHGEKYDYSLVNYKNNNIKVVIICKYHGEFLKRPSEHLNGQGCLRCVGRIVSTEDFIIKANRIHLNRYDYTLVDYKNSENKVKIICKEHGIFEQKIGNHLIQKSGCPKCYALNLKSNTESFINKSIKIHLDRYDYSLVDYKNAKEHVIIICKEHGEFKQAPTHHLSGKGCPICKSSKGENIIFNFLRRNNFTFKHHYIFDDLNNYEFDFYIENLNLLIEYDGVQHFKPISYFGGSKAFEDQKRRDSEKNEYCVVNKINLLRIPYTEVNIESYLKGRLQLS